MKRLLSIILTICMVIAMIPTVTYTAEAYVETPPVYVGGTNVATSSGITYWLNDGDGGITSTGASIDNYNVKYDTNSDGTPTLTLSGAAINDSHIVDEHKSGIYANINLIIELLNSNSIVAESNNAVNKNSFGIYITDGSLTISGIGSLTTTGGAITTTSGIGGSYGISINAGDLTISSGSSVTATGGQVSSLGKSCGIFIYGNMNVNNYSSVTATGGYAEHGDSYGIISANGYLNISGSTVTATGGESVNASYGISANGNINISGGKVTATVGTAPISRGILMSNSGVLSIDDSAKVTANGGNNYDSQAIFPNLITTYDGIIVAGDSENNAQVVANYNGQKYVKFGTIAYTITFDRNGGSGTMTDKIAFSDDVFMLPSCTFSPPVGHQSFYKWAIGSTGGALKAENESHTFTENTTLYAIWTRIEDTPTATFTAIETDEGTLSDVSTDMKYNVDGGTNWITITSTSITISGVTTTSGIKVYKPGNGTTTTDSAIQTISVTKAATPSASKADCTTLSNNDGKLTGVTAEMEYKLSNADSWTDGTVTDITGLSNGTYYVRVKASGTKLASDNQTLTIAAYSAPPSDNNSSDNNDVYIAPDITVSDVKSELFSNASDIKVEADVSSAFGQSVIVKITDVTEAQKEIFSLVGANSKVYPFDISLYSRTFGIKVQPKQGYSVKITLPVPEELLGDKEKIQVVYGKDGKLETLNSELIEKNGKWYISFEAVHFSPYALIVSVNPFSDVKEDDWFYSAVQYAVQNGLMNGTSSTSFSPEMSTSRGMIAAILYRLSGSKETAQSSFKDVNQNEYYANAVAWAEQKGIITGYGNGLFGPDDSITREQLSTMLWKYAGSPVADESKSLDAFHDVKEISPYDKNAITWANQQEIIKGKGGGLLDPSGKATRAEVAQIMKNFMQKSSLIK